MVRNIVVNILLPLSNDNDMHISDFVRSHVKGYKISQSINLIDENNCVICSKHK